MCSVKHAELGLPELPEDSQELEIIYKDAHLAIFLWHTNCVRCQLHVLNIDYVLDNSYIMCMPAALHMEM